MKDESDEAFNASKKNYNEAIKRLTFIKNWSD
jgi:hypothetical protein